MSIADRQNFMRDFRKSYNDQVDALSVAEAKKLDIELKGHDDDFHKKFRHNFRGGFRHGGHGMMAPECPSSGECDQIGGFRGPKQPTNR